MADKHKPKTNQSDYITNKVLLVFTFCMFGVFGLVLLYRLVAYGSTYHIGQIVLRVVLAIGVILLAVGIGKMLKERKNPELYALKLIRGHSIAIVAAIIIACMLIILQFGSSAIKLFYVILPALAIYYLIYYSYPREFFVIAADASIAVVLLIAVRRALNSTNFHTAAYVLAAIALVLSAVQAIWVRKRQMGKQLSGIVDGKETELFTSAHAFQMMYLSALLLVAFVAVGAFAGAQIAYYLIFAAFAYLFITAVYYTVKMM